MKQTNLPHLATRIFNTPLLIHQPKLETILAVLGSRIGLSGGAVITPEITAAAAMQAKSYPVQADICVIPIIGTTVRRCSGLDAISGLTSYAEIEEEFALALADPSCSGILLDIDSPGGEVGGLFDLADMIFEARGQKPIYAVANEDAFSAAYAIASAADRVYVTRTGGVGSIGCFMAHCDMSAADQKDGLKYSFIFAGAKKVDGNPHESLSDSAREMMQAEVDRIYDLFSGTVARNRKMPLQSVKQTQAGLYFGEDGVFARLADAVGTQADAINDMRAQLSQARQSSFSAAAASAASIQNQGENNMKIETTAQIEPTTDAPPTVIEPEAPAPIVDPATPAASVPSASPVDTETLVSEAWESGLNTAAEIVELCAIAKRPGMAAELIRARVSVADARKRLVDAAAADQEQTEIRSTTAPALSSTQQLDQRAAQLATSEGITKQQAFARLLEQNPAVYAEYLESRRVSK